MNWMDADQLNPNALGLIQSCLGSMEFCKGEYFLYGLGQRITCSYLKVTKFSSIYIYIHPIGHGQKRPIKVKHLGPWTKK